MALGKDGSASIRMVLSFSGFTGRTVLLPVGQASLRDLKIKGNLPVTSRVVEKSGEKFVALELPSGDMPGTPASVEVTFVMDGYFRSGPPFAAFGNIKLKYRFVNVSFGSIAKYTASIFLPDGYVFNAVGEFSPQPEKAGMIIPFAVLRENGKNIGRIAIDNIKLGDEVAVDFTFRHGKRSPLLMIILAVLAVAYLIFFRDLLKNTKKDSTAGRSE